MVAVAQATVAAVRDVWTYYLGADHFALQENPLKAWISSLRGDLNQQRRLAADAEPTLGRIGGEVRFVLLPAARRWHAMPVMRVWGPPVTFAQQWRETLLLLLAGSASRKSRRYNDVVNTAGVVESILNEVVPVSVGVLPELAAGAPSPLQAGAIDGLDDEDDADEEDDQALAAERQDAYGPAEVHEMSAAGPPSDRPPSTPRNAPAVRPHARRADSPSPRRRRTGSAIDDLGPSPPAMLVTVFLAVVGGFSGRPLTASASSVPLLISVWRGLCGVPAVARKAAVASLAVVGAVAWEAGGALATWVILVAFVGALLAANWPDSFVRPESSRDGDEVLVGAGGAAGSGGAGVPPDASVKALRPGGQADLLVRNAWAQGGSAGLALALTTNDALGYLLSRIGAAVNYPVTRDFEEDQALLTAKPAEGADVLPDGAVTAARDRAQAMHKQRDRAEHQRDAGSSSTDDGKGKPRRRRRGTAFAKTEGRPDGGEGDARQQSGGGGGEGGQPPKRQP